MSTRLEGLEVPLHRSLVEPMLLAGLPRTVALVLWTSVGAFALGLHQIWVLPLGIGVHARCAKLMPAAFEMIGPIFDFRW